MPFDDGSDGDTISAIPSQAMDYYDWLIDHAGTLVLSVRNMLSRLGRLGEDPSFQADLDTLQRRIVGEVFEAVRRRREWLWFFPSIGDFRFWWMAFAAERVRRTILEHPAAASRLAAFGPDDARLLCLAYQDGLPPRRWSD